VAARAGKMRRIESLDEAVELFSPGVLIVLHSACAEPRFLAAELARIGGRLDNALVHTLMPMGASPYAASSRTGHLQVSTFFPGKGLRGAVNKGQAGLIRLPLSAIPGQFATGRLACGVLLLQVSPPNEQGVMSLGIAVDYMQEALKQNPVVVAEINPAMPFTCGDTLILSDQIDYIVMAKEPPQPVLPAKGDEIERRIAANIAGLIGHGAVLQAGIGALPDLVLGQLGHLRDLGVHSGIMTEAFVPLLEKGAVTNLSKRDFPGVCVTTMAAGTQPFYDFLHRNPAIEFHPCSLTHAFDTLARIDGLIAINSVLQIDLYGRANAERIDGRIISGPGGLPDFARGAAASKGGASILALRSTAKDGLSSNIVCELDAADPVTVTADHIDFVVTEHGVACLTGVSPARRAEALIAIAHPDFRPQLRQSPSKAGGAAS
jgi:4-hydroxybutyrate CoA-transferase